MVDREIACDLWIGWSNSAGAKALHRMVRNVAGGVKDVPGQHGLGNPGGADRSTLSGWGNRGTIPGKT